MINVYDVPNLLLVHLWGSTGGVGWMVSCAIWVEVMVCPCKTWSQMCGSWYLPMFLLSEGSLTHMYIALFMFLVTLYYLPTALASKHLYTHGSLTPPFQWCHL